MRLAIKLVYLLHLITMMNYLDIIIIYLACGSPFGVYYFINNREYESNTFIKSLFITFVWIPYSFKLLHSKVTNKLNNQDFFRDDKVRLNDLQKNFENFLPKDNSEISLFELREIIERYTELTLISSENNGIPAKHEKEIFQVNGNQNIELSAICLNRRNHQRLLFHQTQSRRDFEDALKILLNTNSDNKKLSQQTLEFVRILNDEVALAEIIRLFDDFLQTVHQPAVKHLENEQWTPQELKQSNEKPISIPLQTIRMTANAHKKD